ncbi:MAG: pyridoxal-phosphate dependent enzyme [Desulfotignum sp.]|jgi:L-serine/L-threonine ammonia-lyase|nr:pyridoxal-phosphate dependent enzyme [Desulfotignum sp.]
MDNQKLHIETPLIESLPLSRQAGGRVWLKMESIQPSGSFKLRGIGNACMTHAAAGARQFLSSSGGNAGIAVAYAGRKLGIPVTVVVPETTPSRSIELITQESARVVVAGASWQEAHAHAVQIMAPGWVYIHPFDDPLLWAGHAGMIDETVRQGVTPDAVVLSVGGGGLLCGVIEGLVKNGLSAIPVIAVETEGAASLAASIRKNKHTAVDEITSIATSLGAKKVAKQAFAHALKFNVHSHLVSDRQALDACRSFALDHRVLVEPACGAALAAVYEPLEILNAARNILVVVCGGAGVTMQQIVRGPSLS